MLMGLIIKNALKILLLLTYALTQNNVNDHIIADCYIFVSDVILIKRHVNRVNP